MELTAAFWERVIASSPALALVLVMWFQQRDQTRLLRVMADRLGRVLERARMTPPMGLPIVVTPHARARSMHESDGPPPNVPRTVTDEDIR